MVPKERGRLDGVGQALSNDTRDRNRTAKGAAAACASNREPSIGERGCNTNSHDCNEVAAPVIELDDALRH